MATVTIERPGVQVIQEFQTVSPTILVPTMPSCIMGPCVQIIEAVQDDGSLNSEAQVSIPARFTAPFVTTYATIAGGNTLELSVNNAASVVVTFAAAPTPAEAADAINTAAIPGLLAGVETSGSTSRLVMYTTQKGDNASIRVVAASAAVLTELDLTVDYKARGFSGYTNYFDLRPSTPDYPDPRGIIEDVVIDYSTIRVFISAGGGTIREVLTTETFLDGATSAVSTTDDGDGDNLTPLLNFAGAKFHDQAAELVGTVDWTTLTYPGDFGVLTLELFVNGVTVLVTFASPGNAAAAAAAIDSALGINGSCALNGSNQPVITSALTGSTSSVEVGDGGTINEATIGLVIGRYAAGKPAPARAQGIADITALVWASVVHGRLLRMSLDGDPYQDLLMPATIASATDLRDEILALWGAGSATLNDAGQLVLWSLEGYGGKESVVRIDTTASDATLLTSLGLTGGGAPFASASAVYGAAYSPEVGDEVWVDGIRLGEIIEIPSTPVNRVRISAEQLLTFTGTTWTVQAKGLDNDAPTLGRPSSDLQIDTTTGAVHVKQELFRDTAGAPTLAGPLLTYMAYTALRKDVSPAAEDFNLLRFGTTTDLEAALSPLDTQNPLGFGLYLAVLNAPGVEVTGLGVDETSATETEGTLDAYTRAFEYLESKDVYSIAPLTHSGDVGLVGQVHVTEMSKPENGLERCVLLNPSRPTRASATLVASGALGNVSGPPTNVVQTGIANLQSLLAAAGLPGPSYVEADDVYIEFESDTNKYLVQSVSGGAVTINDGPLSATNDFYLDGGGSPVFTAAVIDRPFTIKIRGAALTNRTDEATAYADIARGYVDRRVIVTAPDTAKASIDGLETSVAGYYLNCALSGKMSSSAPQQPFTEESLVGFTGVIGASDRYGELQLKIMSGGGLWVIYQEAAGQPVKTRHQLTTDMSSIEKREDSIRRALDFTAKFIRGGLRNFIGRFNITTNVQDAISITLDGLGAFLLRQGVLKAFDVQAIRQSSSAPDTLEIDVDVAVFYPLNKIRLTLVV